MDLPSVFIDRSDMEKRLSFVFITMLLVSNVHAQSANNSRINAFLDFTVAIGKQEGTAAFSYVENWRLGKDRKLLLGLGLRWISYTGKEKDLFTAPATLSRTSTVPFLNVFPGHEYQNVDTFSVENPLTSSLNLSINAGYHIAQKWYVGEYNKYGEFVWIGCFPQFIV